MITGRPLKFKSVEELQERIDEYFALREEQGLPFTITGLALHLDTTRDTLCDYEKGSDRRKEFSDTIKKAKMRCEDYAEKVLFTGKNQTGAIFALKNFGWKDQQYQDITSGGETIKGFNYIIPDANNKTDNQTASGV